MNTKLCEACKATGRSRFACRVCAGKRFITCCICDELEDTDETCQECYGRRVVGCSESTQYADPCVNCNASGTNMCLACMGAGVVLIATGRPLPRTL
jgi:hypothetical protein